jgi:hypothetical protein
MVNFLPLYGGLGSNTAFKILGRPEPPPGQGPSTDVRVVDSGYFRTMGIRCCAVATSRRRTREREASILINEALARNYFARKIRLDNVSTS